MARRKFKPDITKRVELLISDMERSCNNCKPGGLCLEHSLQLEEVYSDPRKLDEVEKQYQAKKEGVP